MDEPLRIPVHYDFASSLCYVAHRVMERMAERLGGLGLELCWTPLDLTRITGFRRGGVMPEVRRLETGEIARQLGVALDVRPAWRDSRALGAAAIVAEAGGREASFRELAFTTLYESGRDVEDDESAIALARSIGLEIGPASLRAARAELDERTRDAIHGDVTGVPTFMLGSWPFGGIQTEETMDSVLGRFAARSRGRLGSLA